MRRLVKKCICGKDLTGRRDQKFCSVTCRKQAQRKRVEPTPEEWWISLSEDQQNWQRIWGHMPLDFDSSSLKSGASVTAPKLKFSLLKTPDGFALCGGCGGRTNQKFIDLETEQPPIIQVVPVYHSDCAPNQLPSQSKQKA